MTIGILHIFSLSTIPIWILLLTGMTIQIRYLRIAIKEKDWSKLKAQSVFAALTLLVGISLLIWQS